MDGAGQLFADGWKKLNRDFLRRRLHADIGVGSMQRFSYCTSVN